MSHNFGYNTKESKQLQKALANDPPTTRNWLKQPGVSNAVGFANGGRVAVAAHTRKFAKGGKVCAPKKMALGGAAKVRRGVATPSGKPIYKKCSSRVGANGGSK